MISLLRGLANDEPGSTKAKIAGLYALLLGFNVAAWCWAFVAFHRFPVLLGTAFLAYSFGLRHAVDADHIAAIDNVTRKLMQQGKKPVAVGLMFSLGHSTVVVVGAIAIAATALALQHRIDAVREIGGVIGTLVSALFLFAFIRFNQPIRDMDWSPGRNQNPKSRKYTRTKSFAKSDARSRPVFHPFHDILTAVVGFSNNAA